MKIRSFFALVLFVFVLNGFFSCEKESSPNEESEVFTINGEMFTPSDVHLLKDNYGFEIYLADKQQSIEIFNYDTTSGSYPIVPEPFETDSAELHAKLFYIHGTDEYIGAEGLLEIEILDNGTVKGTFSAQAKNEEGNIVRIGHGAFEVAKDDIEDVSLPLYGGLGTLTDIDGNTYKTVKIRSSWWMVENLRVTHYNNGEEIPQIVDNSEWVNLNTDAYCWYDNDEESYGQDYGALYNWYVIETNKLCPEGWHVPSDTEWAEICHIQGLKETGYLHWASPNTGAPPENHLCLLPGGSRNNSDGKFDGLTLFGLYWSSTGCDDVEDAYLREFRYNNDGDVRYGHRKTNGMSVRCVKDDD